MAAPKKKNEPSKNNDLKKQNEADNKKITKKSSKKKKAAGKVPANKKATKKTNKAKKNITKKIQVKNTKTSRKKLEETDSTGENELTKIAEEERIAKEKALKMEKQHQEEKKAEDLRIAEEERKIKEAEKRAEKIKQVIKQISAKEQQEAYEAEQNLNREDDGITEVSACSCMNCRNINKSFLAAGISFIVILLMLIGTSWKNSGKFYIKNTKAGIEIMQGKFAPLHTKKFIFLKGAKISGTVRSSYNKDTIFPIIFNYYLNETDALMRKPGVPDLHEIMRAIDKASEFALTPQDHQMINQYKTTIRNTMAGIKAITIPKMNGQQHKGAMDKALQRKKGHGYSKP